MADLFADDPKAKSDVVSPSQTTTTAFSSSDDVGTRKPCFITQIHLALPDGESVDVSHVSASGEVSIIRANMRKGPLLIGEHFILHPGENLRFVTVSGTIVSGNREAVVKGLAI